MSEQLLTLTIPLTTYDRLKQRADVEGRTVLDEIVETLRSSVGELPIELQQAIAPLPLYSDQDLWQAARDRLPAEDAAELERLHHKRNRQPLSDEEKRTAARLLRCHERFMLVRAEAAALLKQRGHDVSVLLNAS